jgi:hypothetical protein
VDGVSPVTIVGTNDVSGNSTTGSQVTIFCTGVCRNGDLAVTEDLNRVRETKVKNNIVIHVEDIFQNSVNIGNSKQPLNFTHTLVRDSGTKNMNTIVTAENGDVDHEQLAYLSDITAATNPTNTSVNDVNVKTRTLEQLDAFAGSFPTFDAVPISVVGYIKPISVNHFIHIIEDETLNYKATQYVVTLISLDNGIITCTFDLVLNCHAISGVNEKSNEIN